ncbi:signal transduction histidine kinase : Signal transduction histidine kinase OS=Singulisphaera acidiphila (strain ATCC BAA-1392 / DSM 18658 / VKM B-2454 / MOB10) GN=Sinac_0425 PE=4 SV=1: HAMP: HisKA: HATPase_c [Gemmataceae bacterium]|nr:signal transduction histidine kinase : Signal transduction histidine kinase OS=Singulisphaera acidiphila (strain ATCC BAA-1392 / DSM 18658 / VKM B-2454 / MOB10) GN=Sinac_0425 PE=4 SV=1: HAMP: HisKA: HATPase_c [Gemmataceae bacterium]VTU01432.1 signal transduction histidine kinase : Signal transduction histidine kinase OS=Singulisphaera acidiphila (strain ATCC BAA-1392 / DSM 18658 / VKM B-2454 / MOB10) GN=Sinac_0425 PE=4 SV=1: HAMP: HisKA: HATPase_c [Gemmataceae bacterium]
MTLTTRLTVIALAALAVVLAGFSFALYAVASEHLYRRADDRLTAALNVLVAAAEVKPDGVEWEPAERRLLVGPGAGGDGVVWLVTGPDGRAVDRAVPADAADFLADAATHLRETQRPAKKVRWQEGRWLVRQERVEAAKPALPFVPAAGPEQKFPALVVTAGTSLEPVRATLRELAAVLVGVSLAVWFLTAAAGRAVCRWALRPVTRMADAARGMTAADLGVRLPAGPAKDELADLGRAFNALLGRVEEAFERQRGFTAEASHQLRTPLTALLGQAEVALRRDRDGAEYRRVLGSVRRQADRLHKVVESLLFLARADADAGLPGREAVDLGAWLPEHVRTGWATHARAGDIRVETTPARADVHPVLLGELVDVLVDNACKYSPPGTPVTVRVGPAGSGVELSVEDSGIGLSEGDAARIFEPYVRSAEARRRGVEGSGLGLSVARRVADAHGGTLVVTSVSGKGSRFTLQLSGSRDAPHVT